MRITTGITLALLMSTAGCGGDDEDGGVLSPTGPSAVSSPATPPMGTTNAQAHGGLATAQANNMQSAKPDTRTVDFSSVTWAWNAARTHLEPDSFPDARVRSGSNVWRRDSGDGAHPYLQRHGPQWDELQHLRVKLASEHEAGRAVCV